MNDLIKKGMAFITFDSPLQTAQIGTQFAETHHKRQAETNEWSTKATRQQLISAYWSDHVTGHFAVLFGLPATIFFLLGGGVYHPGAYIIIVFFAGLLTYFSLYLFTYSKSFSSVYLPRLETVKEAYEKKQTKQLEKCRQAQLSNFSLALFFYIIADIKGLKPLTCDDHSANLLMKLYGVDPGSMKKNMELILVTSKRKNMEDRQKTELRNRFAETYDYLEALEFKAGIVRLKELEAKFF